MLFADLLEINLTLTELLAHMMKNSDVHVNPDIWHIDIAEHSNLLHSPTTLYSQVRNELEGGCNTQYIKQGSTMLHEMRKKHELLAVH